MSFHAHIQRFADHSNTLLVGKFVAVASIGIYAGNAFFYSNALMPALAKFSTASSVAVWSEIFHKVKGKWARKDTSTQLIFEFMQFRSEINKFLSNHVPPNYYLCVN